MNEGSEEESLDSIPGPEYETIKGDSATSTPIQEVGNVENYMQPPVVSANVPERTEMIVDTDAIVLDYEDEEMSEVTNEKAMEEKDKTKTEEQKTHIEEIVIGDDKTREPEQITTNTQIAITKIHDNKEKLNLSTSNAHVMPVQIIAAPKILPAKTKDNKLLLVQVISDTGKPLSATLTTSSNSSSTEKSDETTPTKSTCSENDTTPLQHQSPALRSSTPLSREFLALKRSVIQSKILSEYVASDGTTVKARKLRKSGAYGSQNADDRICVKRSTNIDEDSVLGPPSSVPCSSNSGEKRKKYIPLRDEQQSSSEGESRPRHRSRSKSVNRNSSSVHIDYNETKMKRWPSDEKIHKRTNMRSQNSEFVQKQLDFLNRVMQQQRDDGDASDSEYYSHSLPGGGTEDDNSNGGNDVNLKENSSAYMWHSKSLYATDGNTSDDGGGTVDSHSQSQSHNDVGSLEARLKAVWQPPPQRGWDSFCWKCRECGDLIPCSKCQRCFHTTCIKVNAATKLDNSWICPECIAIENVLNSPRSRLRRSELSSELLSQLLSFALKRMRNVKGYPKALFSTQELAAYSKYIVNPVTFALLQDKIEKRIFRCAEEFVNETKWMLHNALILGTGTSNSKEVLTSKAILKICRQESIEIDTCAECYLNANTRSDWFVDVCAQPHLLLWAKLKGFPYWPAKAMGPGQHSLVNVRFFGEHDRAFVPVKDCFLYSEQDPNTQTGKRSARELADCIKEVEIHIEKIKEKVGAFRYANFKTQYDPAEELQQLETMMPGVTEYMNRQQALTPKPPLQYKIVKTADNNLSIIKKASVTDSSNDSDHSPSPNKKNESVDVGRAKYEVICKNASDDSNSSKLSTVILKRKSLSSEQKKSEESEIISAKTVKADEAKLDKQKLTSGSLKRRGDLLENEKYKTKHTRHSDQKVPKMMLTLKSYNTENLTESKDATMATESNSTQNTMENLVKNKQGVTIKLIPKDIKKDGVKEVENSITNENVNLQGSSSASTNVEATTECKEKIANEKSKDNEKTDRAQKVQYILKDLVPFVEVKTEVPSDDEDQTKNSNSNNNNKTNEKINIVTEIVPSVNEIKSNIPAITTTKPQTEQTEQVLLANVKQEIMSDDEDANTSAITNDPQKELLLNKATTSALLTTNDSVRVVGDTTIQRLSVKNASSANNNMNNINNSSCNSISNIISNGTQCVMGNKRVSMRGVPYGPLPAAAMVSASTTPATNVSNIVKGATVITHSEKHHHQQQQQQPIQQSHQSQSQQQQTPQQQQPQQHQQTRHSQRARKSFPNRSNTDVSPTRTTLNIINANGTVTGGNINNLSNALVPLTTTLSMPTTFPITTVLGNSNNNSNNNINTGIEKKRSLLKTTNMVAIPVDVATSRSSNPIPVPPLTAVSKCTLPAPVTTATCVVSLPVTTNASLAGGTLITTAPPVGNCNFVGTCNGNIPPKAMLISTPPPLAGLSLTSATNAVVNTTLSMPTIPSNSNVNSNINNSVNVNNITNSNIINSTNSNNNTNVTMIGTTAAAVSTTTTITTTGSNNTAEGHLLGDFVTPTLASAITEVICRGPPKMIARPSGPLQSEGSVLFPSQAGPVCRTLVENAHKLTDFFISVMEDTMCEMSVNDDSVLQSKITLLTMELERTKQAYEHEIAELKRTSDLMLCEMRKSMENEKTRLANDIRKQCELERLRSVEETKKKQWCANCGREAQFYCCWNTSYCDYPCQQLHWSRHAASCAQTRPSSNEASNTTNMPGTTINSQQERSYPNVKGNTATQTTVYNSKPNISHKKDKHVNKANAAGSTTITTIPGNTAQPTEVLKLPSNTYLRPITAAVSGSVSNTNNTPVRSSAYAMSFPALPVQRFNIPLPITAAVNSTPPYKIVQRGGSWELMSAGKASASAQTTNAPLTTQTAVQQQQQQQQNQPQQPRNKNPGSGRNRGTSAHNLSLNTTLQNVSSGGSVLRSTQM